MKAWLFQNFRSVSDSYHANGGLLVIASSPKTAKALIHSKQGTKIDEYGPCVDVDLDSLDFRKADATFVVDAEPALWVFPDAGCC